MGFSDTIFDLRRLLGAAGIEAFFAENWQKQALAAELAPDDFDSIRREVGPLEIARLAPLARRGVQAWLADDVIAHSVIPVTAADAAQFLGVGATLYFFDLDLPRLTQPLADGLGAPRAMVRASLFLTPAAGGAAPHFDANETFTVQLTGHKRWILSGAPMVEGAPDVFTLGRQPPPSLTGLMREPGGPERIVDLKPGSFLYVPRGVVHRTEGGGEGAAWSLSLSYDRTMWVELFCKGLACRLGQEARWRGSVAGIGASDPAAASANIAAPLAAELRALLADPAILDALVRDFFQAPG